MQDATKAFKKLITEKQDVDGLPESALALAAQQVCAQRSQQRCLQTPAYIHCHCPRRAWLPLVLL